MKSRPILFTAPMVRALLDGSKTQTRRAAKLTDAAHVKEPNGHRRWHPADPAAVAACPYGQVGDQLWVRETFLIENDYQPHESVIYRADGMVSVCSMGGASIPWKPSIFMPRWASRITLEITSVRVERLNEITRGDCMAEGCPFQNIARETDPKQWYSDLWESINGAGSWDLNPWVWVVEFKRIGVPA